MRFEYFLTLLKHTDFMIGNSSAGIRETGIYCIPSIDIGNRQKGRYNPKLLKNVTHVIENKDMILDAIKNVSLKNLSKYKVFGEGNSDKKFIKILESSRIWDIEIQKKFIDIEF